MFCSFYLILYIIWFQFSLSLSPFYYFDYYEHQYFTSVLFHLFSFIKNALFGSYSWMSHRTFIESSAVTTAFWLDQYGGRFASIFRRCPPSMFWGQWIRWITAGGGHSHFGGVMYVGLLRPPFSAPLSTTLVIGTNDQRCTWIKRWDFQNWLIDPILFFFNQMALAQWRPIFSFDLSPKASNF